MTDISRISKGVVSASALAILLAVSGCGGGGGGGAAGASVKTTSKGVVSGFGSVVVKGVKYGSGAAGVTMDGDTGAETDLRVGMVVTVDGSVNSDNITGTASSISYNDNLQGPITALDASAKTIAVLTQTIKTDNTTIFENASGLSALNIDDIVEVSGFPDSTGALRACYIEKKAPGAETEIKGYVSDLDTSAMTFTLKISAAAPPITVHYTTLPAEFDEGRYVEVRTATGMTGDSMTASMIEVESEMTADGGDHVEIEGLITDFISPSDFKVNGVPVDASGIDTAGFANDVMVEIEGRYSNGTVVAEEREIEWESNIFLKASLAGNSPSGITLLGKTVTVTGTTEYKDSSSASVRTFGFSDLAAGDSLEVAGYKDPASGIVATAVIRVDHQSPQIAAFQGTVDSKTPPDSLVILGETVNIDASTTFKDGAGNATDPATFFSSVTAGSTVVKAQWNSFTDISQPAHELEIED